MIGITIAGFDPSGGAGISNDIKTFQALDIYSTSVITALTAQTPEKVFDLKPVSIEFIKKQLNSILTYYDIEFGKTGMLYSSEIIKLVGNYIDDYDLKFVVDPVMVASSGGELSKNRNIRNRTIKDESIKCRNIRNESNKDEIGKALKKYILPNCLIVTPNLYEAELLSGIKINNLKNAEEAAIEIANESNVVITGGHLNGNNLICKKGSDKVTILKEELLDISSTHGTGCCLSAAISAYTIKEYEIEIAIEKATKFVKKAIENNWYGTIKQL